MADVKIVHEDGRVGSVPEANLAAAEKLGWKPASEKQLAEANRGSLAETVARNLPAAAAGTVLALPKAVSGLGAAALGVEDPLAKISGRQVVTDLSAIGAHLTGGESELAARKTREGFQSDPIANPITTFGSELAGTAIGAGVGGLSAAGRGVGGLAARGLGALGAGARAARIGAGVASGVLEGGALGADAASENAWLKNQTSTAEQTLAGMGMGALFGGAGGGLIGGLGRGGSKAAKLSEQLAEAGGAEGGAAAGGLEAAGARAESAAGAEAGGWVDSAGRRGPGAPAAAAADVAAEEGSVLGQRGVQKAAGLAEAAETPAGRKGLSWLSGVVDGDKGIVNAIADGDKTALKALGTEGAAPTAARMKEVGSLIHELGIPGVGRSNAEMAEVAGQRATEMAGRVGKIMQAADARVAQEGGEQLAENVFSKVEALKTKLGGEVILGEGGGAPAWLDNQTAWLRQKAAAGELLPSDLEKFRVAVGERLATGPNAGAARQLETALKEAVHDEVAKTSPKVLGEYQRAEALKHAAEWAQKTLTERAEGGEGMSLGTIGGALLFGHGNPVLGLAAHLGGKAVKERLGSTAAVLAKKFAGDSVDVAAAPLGAVATARGVQSMVARTEQHISEGIGEFFGQKARAAAARTQVSATASALRSADLGTAQKAYQEHARNVQMVAEAPEVAASRLAGITGHQVAAVAPGLNAAMAQVAARGANYLMAHMPAPPSDPDSITPQLDSPPPVSHSDLGPYADRVEGVEHPLSLVDDIKKNKVSPEKTDAVKTVYPDVFERIRANIFAHLAERTEPVPHDKRLVLDLTLDGNGTLEPSLSPAALACMRQVNDMIQRANKPPPQAGAAPRVANLYTTRTAQISAGKGA